MSKFFCVYMGREYDESERTEEHIVPYSIGGSDDFVTHDVSKEGNDTAGYKWDAPLIKHRMIELARYSHKVASKEGHIPSYRVIGTIRAGDETSRGYVDFLPSGEVDIRRMPEVHFEMNKHRVWISCDPRDRDEVLANVERKLKRRGFALPPDPMASAQHTKTWAPMITGPMKLDLSGMQAGFVKMALGVAHDAFGYSWSQGAPADRLRAFLHATPEARKKIPIHGRVWPAGSDADPEGTLRRIMRVTEAHHVLGVFNTGFGRLAFYGLLFGTYDAVIDLGSETFDIPPCDGIAIVIDVRSRLVQRRTILNHTAAPRGVWVTGWTPQGPFRLVG